MTSWFSGVQDAVGFFVNPTTNGSALAFSKEESIVRGVFEVIQRDSFFVHWLTGIAPTRIDIATLPDESKEIVDGFKARGITLYILNTTTNITIPSVCIIAISHEALNPGVVVSAATAFSFGEAIEDALREMTICSQPLEEDITPAVFAEPFVADLNKDTRPHYWRGKERIKECEWFLSGDIVTFASIQSQDLETSTCDVKEKLSSCLEMLAKNGEDYHPILYRPINSLQKELGFYVSQVFIPKAFPLYLIEKYGTFDSDRLHEFATFKGKKDWVINKTPHMFV